MTKWITTKRRDWPDTGCVSVKRWVVHRDGEERGTCECWTEEDANTIADGLNFYDQLNELTCATSISPTEATNQIAHCINQLKEENPS